MRLKKKTDFKSNQIVILLLLFLGTINVGNLYFYFIFAAASITILLNARSIRIDRIFVVLLLFALCYIIFYPSATNSFKTILKYALYPMCYLLGLNFLAKERETGADDRTERQIATAITICAMGMFVHYLLNMSVNFDRLVRNSIDFWTGELMAATGQAGLAILALGVFVAWLFDDGKKKLYATVGLFLILLYNMVLAGRTLILLAVLLVGVAFFYNIKNIRAKENGKVLCTVFVVSAVLLIGYAGNWFGVREFILGSNLSERFDSMDMGFDIRLARRIEYLARFFDYPFGGGTLRDAIGGYAHELYLDTYSDAGIFAYILVIVFAVDSFYTAFKIIRNGEVGENLKLLILCVYMAAFLEFLIEPIIQGMPWMFCTFCFLSGLLKNVRCDGQVGGTT